MKSQIHEPLEKSITLVSKNLTNYLIDVLSTLTFSKEKMPALIPVRVITKVHPDQHR
jgi:hypothetical protein